MLTPKVILKNQYPQISQALKNTCDKCSELDGQVFPMSAYQPGLTANPFHPWCRCCTAPYFADMEGVGERYARDIETGKAYSVPRDTTYEQWKNTFVDKLADSNKLKAKFNETLDRLSRNRPSISLSKIETEYRDDIFATIDASPELFRNLVYGNQDSIVFAKTNARAIAQYKRRYGIFINLDKDYVEPKGKWTTLFHEIGHNVDKIYGYPSNQKNFVNFLEQDFFIFTSSYGRRYNIGESEAYASISKALKGHDPVVSHVASDLFGAMSNNQCVGDYYHPDDYWKSPTALPSEAFAHFFSATVCGDQRKLQSIKSTFPRAYQEFIRIVEGLK